MWGAAVLVGLAAVAAMPAPHEEAPKRAGAVSADDAVSYVGRTATVEGIANEVYVARSGKVTFIDMGGDYPDNPFAAVIFADRMAQMGDLSVLAGKVIDVTGPVTMYRGRAEIIVNSRNQITAH